MAKDTCWQLLLQALQHVLLPWFPTKVDARRAGVQSSIIVVDRQVHQLFQAAEQSADQTIVLKGPNSCQVSRADFRTLKWCQWLNDEVINLYMQLLQEHNLQQCTGGNTVPKAFIFNTFFWTRLACFGNDFDYAGVARWTKNVNVFSQDLLIIPINHDSLHWCLATVDMRSRAISYYDSMRGSGLSGHAEYWLLPTLAKWLAEERIDKGQLSQTTDWHQVTVKELPEQHDGGSCGVFSCMYAKYLVAGSNPAQAFSQSDIPRLRLQMAADLLQAYGLSNTDLPADSSVHRLSGPTLQVLPIQKSATAANMNPEMMKLAMEQMSKMSPEQMADMQRTMGHLTPAQMQAYQQQAASLSPDDIRRARTQMNGMTPDQLKQAAGQASASLSAHDKYQLDGANSLKAAGNQLHSSRQYAAAIDKYSKAKSNLTGQPSDQAKDVRKACMLNICSCHLNLGQLDFCIMECNEVLSIDASNRKALYRRGQAYSGLSRYAEAVQDLTKALDMSPANEKEVIAAKLKEAQQGAASQASASQDPPAVKPQSQPNSTTPGPPAEQPSTRSSDAASSSSQAGKGTVEDGHVSDAESDTVEEIPAAQPQVARQQPMGGAPMGMPPGAAGAPMGMPPGMDPEQMRRMMQDPSMMQQAANMMSSMDPAQLESMSRMAGAPAGMQISPEMLKSVSSMMSSMSPEMMQSMMSMASSSGAANGAAPPPGAPAASGQQTAPGQQMAAGGPQMGPGMMDQIQQRLSDPATADLISAFTQTMKPEDLAGMLKSGGIKVTPEQAAQYLTYAKRVSPANMRRLLRLTAYGVPVYTLATQSRQFFKQHPLVFWAIVVLLLALLLKLLGWV